MPSHDEALIVFLIPSVYTKHNTQYTIHKTQYTIHSTQYTIYTVHNTQCSVHHTQDVDGKFTKAGRAIDKIRRSLRGHLTNTGLVVQNVYVFVVRKWMKDKNCKASFKIPLRQEIFLEDGCCEKSQVDGCEKTQERVNAAV